MRTTAAFAAMIATMSLGECAFAGGAQFFGPTPYLCIEDSPFDISGLGVSFFLEDFEDGLVNAPGLAATGFITGPGGITDSVDCDDGIIDNSGVNGRSMFNDGATGIYATFDAAVLGGFPTSAGMVWTDGGATNTVTFQAWDAAGILIGSIVAPNIGDGNFNSDTAEDRFFGVHFPGGISKIYMKLQPFGGGSGIEIDHIQYGFANPIHCTPTPDIDGNGSVNGADLGQLLANWNTDTCATDLNGDGTTNGADLGMLLAAWTG